MMTAADFLDICIYVSLVFLALSFLLIAFRIMIGPTLPDRILALDMLVAVGLGFIAVIAIKTHYFLYLDIAIALGLVGFLATVAFARFVISRDRPLSPEAIETLNDNSKPAPEAASGGEAS